MFFYFAAMQMTVLVRPLLAYDLSGSPLALGLTVAANSAPSLVLSPWAGALADRVSMRGILQVCAVGMAVLAGITGLGVALGVFQWWDIAIIGLVQGSVMTFITPTRRAIIPSLVPKSHLLNAVSLHTSTQNLNRTIMPAIAGVVFQFFGAQWALWLIAGMYVLAITLLFSVPMVKRERASRKSSMAGSVGEGFRYALRNKTLRNLLLIGLVGSVFGQPIQQLLPLFEKPLGMGAAQIGLLFTFMGIGSLMGSTTAASLGDFKHKGLLLIGFFTMLGLSIVAFAASGIYLVALFMMIPVGIGWSGRTAVYLATLQSYSDPSMHGRVMALNSMQSGLMPFAVLVITGLASSIGPQWAMGLAGGVILAYGLWEMLFSRTVRELH